MGDRVRPLTEKDIALIRRDAEVPGDWTNLTVLQLLQELDYRLADLRNVVAIVESCCGCVYVDDDGAVRDQRHDEVVVGALPREES